MKLGYLSINKQGVVSMEWGLIIAILTLVAGIIVLIWPKILNYIVAAYLIITGILGIIAAL
jgi:uncharacterized membrane protein YhhN